MSPVEVKKFKDRMDSALICARSLKRALRISQAAFIMLYPRKL